MVISLITYCHHLSLFFFAISLMPENENQGAWNTGCLRWKMKKCILHHSSIKRQKCSLNIIFEIIWGQFISIKFLAPLLLLHKYRATQIKVCCFKRLLATTMKIFISDPILLKPKCVLEASIYFWKL